ncbi:hypothetical protein A6A06_16170 [Streptomyces sp. CB02923]|uniref:S66 peptidase family protein n=1 Tax=Streptomyces sp. CB02923 TaxID=1718985 RepID=UPI00093997AC|nr:LD-carboxypeptidase [Streptomyces sp. CB02923]OKI02550.1 hypothetical protein A6A06_16170 [Streptomyces sp. CB02923]
MDVGTTTAHGPAGAPVRPPAVRRGDRVALLSLSGPLAARCPRRLARSVADLRRRGLCPEADVTVRLDEEERAGDGRTRAERFTAAVLDPGVRAVFSTVGGLGCRDMLPHLDPRVLAASPTAVVGYSDMSSLLLWLHQTLGWVTYYGPAALPQFGEFGGSADYTWDSVWAQLSGGPTAHLPTADTVTVETLFWDSADDRRRVGRPAPPRQVWQEGTGSGPLVAANIATLAEDVLCRALPEHRWPGRVIFLEESDTATWEEFEQSVEVLRAHDVVRGAAALVFGRFGQVHREQWSARQVRRALAPLVRQTAGPVVAEAEFGHTDPVLTLPIGAYAEVGTEGGAPRLTVREAAAPEAG